MHYLNELLLHSSYSRHSELSIKPKMQGYEKVLSEKTLFQKG